MTTASTSRPIAAAPSGATRWLVLGTVVGPILFTLAWIVLPPLHPGYSPASRPISALAIGPNGGFMRAGFLLYGFLGFVGVIAIFQRLKGELGSIARWTCMSLLAISPLGILWAGVLTMDNNVDLHNIGVVLAIGTPAITFPIAGFLLRRAPNWRRFGTLMLWLAGPLTLILLVGFSNSVPQAALHSGAGGGSFGLWQRALAIDVPGWFVAMGWHSFRTNTLIATDSRSNRS